MLHALQHYYAHLSPRSQFYVQIFWISLRVVIALLFAQKGVHFVYQGF